MSAKLTEAEWRAEGTRLFGPDAKTWRFVCPVCKHVATPADWHEAGAHDGAIAFSCVGRFMPNPEKRRKNGDRGPCDYAGGGLFKLNPTTVVSPDGSEHQMFAFAEDAGRAALEQEGT
jgi:hypothetical protein